MKLKAVCQGTTKLQSSYEMMTHSQNKTARFRDIANLAVLTLKAPYHDHLSWAGLSYGFISFNNTIQWIGDLKQN